MNGVAVEVADIVRTYRRSFLAQSRLTCRQKRVLFDLGDCRTAALGGHVEGCDRCGHQQNAYNSCRNRHCPKCLSTARAAWLEREASYLLPVEYHHVVFTLPAELGDLALSNQKLIYGMLFRAAAETLSELAADPHYLGGQPGVLSVLHTWGQNLHYHPHIHCIVTGGGLSCDVSGKVDAEPRWVSCRPGFFLPVRVLSRLFRGKFLARLRAAFEAGELYFPERLADLAEPPAFAAWLRPLYGKQWVVYSKAPFGGPEQVLKYLARYTHRVAISNGRLLSFEEGRVTFRYKDYRRGHRQRRMTLMAEEFLRRFLLHVLPKGLVKIRHYGLLANRRREERLADARRLLFKIELTRRFAEAHAEGVTPACHYAAACPVCGEGQMLRYWRLWPVREMFVDTS
jgi:hypothetical protein